MYCNCVFLDDDLVVSPKIISNPAKFAKNNKVNDNQIEINQNTQNDMSQQQQQQLALHVNSNVQRDSIESEIADQWEAMQLDVLNAQHVCNFFFF